VAVRVLAPQIAPHAYLFREDPAIGMRGIPGLNRRVFFGPDALLVRTSSRGYRGREYDWARPAPLRLFGIGDSFTFGFGVEEEDTFLARIESALGPRAEAINAGVPGTGPDNALRLLEIDGPGLRPHVVLFGLYVGNDFADVLLGPDRSRIADGLIVSREGLSERWYRPLVPGRILPEPLPTADRGRGLPIPFKQWLQRHSHAYRLVSGRYSALRRRWRGEPSAPRAASTFTPFEPEAFCLRSYPPEFDEAWARTQALLLDMKRWCDHRGVRFAVAVIPTKGQVDPAAWEDTCRRYALRAEDFDLDKPQAVLRRFAETSSIEMVDLLAPLRAAREEGGGPLYRKDIHWTARGHAVAADTILRELRAKGMLPDR
jgi:acetyltransferase AlgX (SGNH hydrolase-like protein)